MKNKTDIQTKNQQIDKILQEQYDAETKILESALLNVAGKTSWDEFPEESEEKIRAGYDRLITRLRETGDFNEAARAEKTGSTRAAKEKLEILEYDWNRTHRILKSAAAAVAVVMLTALVGMTAIADCRYPDKNTQTYQKTSVFEKKLKNFIFLCDICRFDSHSICNESLRSRNPAFYSSDKCADQRLGTKRYIFMH
ncbi:MAG: hypothetical protein ACLUGJ_02220 [Blautia wexlerae]